MRSDKKRQTLIETRVAELQKHIKMGHWRQAVMYCRLIMNLAFDNDWRKRRYKTRLIAMFVDQDWTVGNPVPGCSCQGWENHKKNQKILKGLGLVKSR